MLAEIFMLRLETLSRVQTSGFVKSSSTFVPFDRKTVESFRVARRP
jgi:hypothetical protein